MLLCYKQLALLAVGRPDEAVQAGALGVEHADRLDHAHTRGFSRTVFTMLRYLRRDPLTRAQAEDVCLFTESQHFANLVGVIQMILGELLVAEGVSGRSPDTTQRGLDLLRRGAEAHSGMEARTYRPFGLGLAASATLRVGRFKEATAILDAALAMVAETGERWYLPELLRLRGECLWRQAELEANSPSAAREQLEAACAEAASQGARFWALRASTSLARLMLAQGESRAACERLAAAGEGFTESRPLPDLEEARQILREEGAHR
jgi:predicted ATPase